MSKLYGSLDNRIEENRNFLGRPEIKVGDDITQYHWSDRTCYYVTRVENQKHIFVKRYQVCADHEKPGGMGHQDWLYFKTEKEEQAYINECVDKGLLPDYCKHPLEDIKESGESELVFRYGHWYWVARYWYDKPLDKPQYTKANISFGVRDYYYDWEF